MIDIDQVHPPMGTPDKKKHGGPLSRLWGLMLAKPIVTFLLVSSLVSGAIVLTYSQTSTLTTGVTPPPIQFVAGADTSPLTDYITAFSVSTNKTSISATVKGVPEATLTIDSIFKLTNVDNAAHTATLSTPQVSNAYVSSYIIEIYDTTPTLAATLTLTAASPSASVTIPAGETWTAKLTLQLASGAGSNNVALTNAITMSVSS